MLNVKIDSKLKKEAQEIVEDLGLSISAVVSNALKELVQEKRVVFSLHPEPSEETKKILKSAGSRKAKKEAKSFKNKNEAEDFLMSL